MSGRPQRVGKCVTTQHFPSADAPLARVASQPRRRCAVAPPGRVEHQPSACGTVAAVAKRFQVCGPRSILCLWCKGGGSASGTEGALVNASLEGSPGKLWAPKQNYMPYTAGAKKGPCYGAAETAGCSGTFERPTTAKRRPS